MTKQTNTYTTEEVYEIIDLALGEWDKSIDRMIESFEKDKDFEPKLKREAEFFYSSEDAVTQQKELANFKVLPSDYLYNARGDTSQTHGYLAIEVLKEFNETKAKEQAKRLLELTTGEKQTPSATDILKALRARKRGGSK